MSNDKTDTPFYPPKTPGDKAEKVERLVKAVADFLIHRSQLRAIPFNVLDDTQRELRDARNELDK